MTYETVTVEVTDKIAVVTMNRPEKRNAMNPALTREMAAALEALRYDSAASVIVITGAGDAFCAGMDLKEFFAALKIQDPDEYDRVTRISLEWRGPTLKFFPKPTIAMINGHCFGGAFGIVESCDLAIASDDAQFGLSEINFGMFPGGSASKSIANLLRPRDALLYALTGRRFDGKKAAEIGFVNSSVPRERLREETMALAREIAQKDPVALRATKEAFRFSQEVSWHASVAYTHAKENEVYLLQNGAWIDQGIGDFAKGLYKPGMGTRPDDKDADEEEK